MKSWVVKIFYGITSILITYLVVFKTKLYNAIYEGKISFLIMVCLLAFCIFVILLCIDWWAFLVDQERERKRSRHKKYKRYNAPTKRTIKNIDVRKYTYGAK